MLVWILTRLGIVPRHLRYGFRDTAEINDIQSSGLEFTHVFSIEMFGKWAFHWDDGQVNALTQTPPLCVRASFNH